jgi:parallel beta-helix repeat protein
MKKLGISLFLIFLLAPVSVRAATYHVDASTGNDAWSGRVPTATGADGPWRSLSRVRSAALMPGDTVLLKCGEVWHEPLTISASGTPALPIVVGAYPGGCSARPMIDGSIDVPATSWSLYGGNIYRTALPIPLLANSQFDSGTSGWRAWSPTSNATIFEGTDCAPGAGRCLSFASGPGQPNSQLTSPRFTLETLPHVLSFRVKAPAGVVVRVVLRRDAAPWDNLGIAQAVTGTGAWSTFSFPFQATTNTPLARLDFEVPANRTISVDAVSVAADIGTPHQLISGGVRITPARHPNPGHDATRPKSPYILVAQNSDQVTLNGRTVSTYLTTGTDLRLPPGATITPGLGVRIRTVSWLIDERTVTGMSGSRLLLDSPTSYALKAGWGYFLTGALWMLDSPGEWHYDATGRMLYVWMPDSAAPGSRISVGTSDVGIDVSNRSNVVIDGLAVRRVGTGVRMTSAQNVTLRNSQITDTTNEGIEASGSIASTIDRNTIARTGRDAVAGLHRPTSRLADQLQITANEISESGVLLNAGNIISSPMRTEGTIHPGTRANVYGNRIVNSAFNAVWPRADSTIEHNYIEGSCLVLDDCAGIYLGFANNSVVTGNLIVRSVGAVDGKAPVVQYTQAQGIYLDDNTENAQVTENTVIDADHGIQIHNAHDNRIELNTLYGNRRTQIWLQAESNLRHPDGDVYGNTVTTNILAPITTDPAVVQTTMYANTHSFANFSGNVYSGLLAPQMAREAWSGGDIVYGFADWKAARTQGGAPRNLDPNGRQITLTGFASYQITGSNIVPNGSLASGITGWESWTQLQPAGTLTLGSCAGFGPCLQFQVGASTGIVSTANFQTIKDQWYRVSFDVMTGTPGQVVRWVVRRGGGGANSYEALMGGEQRIFGTTTWKRYSLTFKASKTVNVNDPLTLDRGARLDFHGDTPGQLFWVGNAEIVPVVPVGASLRTQIVYNPTMIAASVSCPDTGADISFCSKYVRFFDGLPVTWPHPLPPLGSTVIYSRGDTLADADGDGVADMQDQCPSTTTGLQVNSRGCSIGQ